MKKDMDIFAQIKNVQLLNAIINKIKSTADRKKINELEDQKKMIVNELKRFQDHNN